MSVELNELLWFHLRFLSRFINSKISPDEGICESFLSSNAVCNGDITLYFESGKSIVELFHEVIGKVLVTELVLNFIISEILFQLSFGSFKFSLKVFGCIKDTCGFLSQSSSQFLETIEVMESFIDLLSSLSFGLQVSNGSVKLVSDFVSSSASGTEGEDHFPEVATSLLGLCLQILNLNIISFHSLLELFLDIKENVVEIVRSFGAVLLKTLQDFND